MEPANSPQFVVSPWNTTWPRATPARPQTCWMSGNSGSREWLPIRCGRTRQHGAMCFVIETCAGSSQMRISSLMGWRRWRAAPSSRSKTGGWVRPKRKRSVARKRLASLCDAERHAAEPPAVIEIVDRRHVLGNTGLAGSQSLSQPTGARRHLWPKMTRPAVGTQPA